MMAGMVRYADRHNSGTNIMGIINHLLVGLKACSTGKTSLPDSVSIWLRNSQVPVTNLLLFSVKKNHKLPSKKFKALYPWLVELSNLIRETSLICEQWLMTKFTSLIKLQSVTTVLGHKWSIYSTSLQGAGHHCWGSEKIVKARGQEVKAQMSIFWR